MNNSDLDAKLKSIPLPERADEYWENFPSKFRFQIRRSAPEPALRENLWPQFAWKMSTGFACLCIGLIALGQPLKAASSTLFKNERFIQQQLAQLPNHLRVFMADEHGLHYLVTEKE
jgi:hypothetical protein